MDTLHDHILNAIRDDVMNAWRYNTGAQRGAPPDHQLFNFIFKNYRACGDGHKGLRLTWQGRKILANHYDSHEYDMPDGPTPIKNKVLVALDRKMMWPYYIGKSKIVFFNRTDAGWYKLNGYSLEGLLESM